MGFLTKLSLKNAAAVVILVILVTVGGVFAATQLKQEMMPDISIPIIAVMTPYPGASPRDVLDDVTKPIEDSLSGVAGIKNVNSTSAENVSMIIAEFGFDTDMDDAKRRVTEAMGRVKLPQGAMPSEVNRLTFGSMPVLKASIANDNVPVDRLERAVADDIIPTLSGIEGVGSVSSSADNAKAVYVRLVPDKLAKHNLTSLQVMQLLQANNLSLPVGSLDMGSLTKPVRVSGRVVTVKDLKNLEIPLQPNPADAMKGAFTAIGSGMGQLGQAVGQVGQAVGTIGKGMAGMNQGLNGQIALVNAIADMQSKIMQAKIDLAAAEAGVADPAATPEQKAAAGKTAGMLKGRIAGMQAGLNGMQAKLAQIQKAMTSMGGGSGSMQMSGGGGASMGGRSSGGSSGASATKIKTVHLRDVAEITVGNGSATSYTRNNGKPSVVIEMVKSQEANTVDVVDRVKTELAKTKGELPSGSTVTYTYDQSEQVKNSINGMMREGLLGALFAFLVILLFLRNVRSTLISIVSIPLSILIALVFVRQAGITLNVMTLGGLTVAIGRVVDDSIVVIENIYRRLSETEDRSAEVVRQATAEVATAITSSTLTTVAVFLPLGLVSGMVGKVFNPFAITVGLSLLASLLVAVTVVPLVAKFVLVNATFRPHKQDRGRLIAMYQGLLRWSLDHKLAVFATAIVLLVGSVALMPYVGTGFMPQAKERFVSIDIEYPEGTNAAAVNRLARKIEGIVDRDPMVTTYQTTVGSPEGSEKTTSVRGTNVAQVFSRLTDGSDVDKTIARYKKELAPLAGRATIKVSEGGGDFGGNGIEVYVRGENLAKVKAAATALTGKLAHVDGIGDVSNNLGKSKPEIAVNVDQNKAAVLGLSAGQVAETMRSLLSEQAVGTMTVDKKKVDIKLGLKLDPVHKLSDLESVKILSPLGKKVRLGKIATVKQVGGPVTIYTRDGEQYAVVKATTTDKDMGKVSGAVSEAVEAADLPAGVTTSLGGDAQGMNEAFGQLGMAMLFAIGAVYLVMILAFGEATAPLAILFSLPLAIIGGIFGLFVVGQPLDMPAMIGALMLIGIVVTNAIVLVDRVQQKRAAGMPIREALVEAGTVRMRPILMTAIATITALLPLAAGTSEGGFMSQSLAAIVIGGLTTSTLLTLIVVPVAYEMLNHLFKREKSSAHAAERQRVRGFRPHGTVRPAPDEA